VHALCATHCPTATHSALEEAMAAASRHVRASAPPAVAALLPADVPAAAKAAAAALTVEGCLANCAHRLLQQVPALVHAQLSQQADQLVKVIGRQLAVHARLTAAAPSGGGASGGCEAAALGSSSKQGKAGAEAPATRGELAGAALGSQLQHQDHQEESKQQGQTDAASQQQQQQQRPSGLPPAPARDPLLARSAAAARASDGGGDGGTPGAVRARRRITPMRVEPSCQQGEGLGTPSSAPRPPAKGSPAARQASGQLPFVSPAEAVAPVLVQATDPEAAAAALADEPAAKPTALERMFAAASCEGDVAAGDQDKEGPCTPKAKAAALRESGSPGPQAAEQSAQQEAAAETLAAILLAQGQLPTADLLTALAAFEPSVTRSSSGAGAAAAAAGCDPRGRPDAGTKAVVGVCAAAARICVAAVEQRKMRLSELEDKLGELLASVPEPKPKPQASPTAGRGEAAAAAAAALEKAEQLRERGLLLCGAMLHTYLRSAFHEHAVWRLDECSSSDDGAEGGGVPLGLQSFVHLPTQMMRAVRAGSGLAVLRQLRLWLQDATLGDAWAMDE